LIRSRNWSHQLCFLLLANSFRARIRLSAARADAVSSGCAREVDPASAARASRKSRAWLSCSSRRAGSLSALSIREVNGEAGTSYCCSPDFTTHFEGSESRKACNNAGDFRAISSSDFRRSNSMANETVSKGSAGDAEGVSVPAVRPDTRAGTRLENKIIVRTAQTLAAEPPIRRRGSGSISSKHARHAAGTRRRQRVPADPLHHHLQIERFFAHAQVIVIKRYADCSDGRDQDANEETCDLVHPHP
jgi:hypothetical protein